MRGGMAEWLKAAVLKTVERKFRGFESYFLRHIFYFTLAGEVTELADGARLLSECGGYTSPRVRIPLSPPFFIPIQSRSIPQALSVRAFSFILVLIYCQ